MSAPLSSNSEKMEIYVWDTKVGGDPSSTLLNNESSTSSSVGHVAAKLKSSSTASESQYLSVHPQYSWSVNPFTIPIPVPAMNASSLDQDIILEGRKPDHVYEVPLTQQQFSAASKAIDQEKEAIKNRSTLYHLFPGTSLLSVSKLLANENTYQSVSRCPISGNLINCEWGKDVAQIKKIKETHCALSVNKVLTTAGFKIPENSTPWKVTPSQIGDGVSKKSN
jgi:hypothetical protein